MTNTLTVKQIDELEAMLAKATDGKWEVQDSNSWRRIGVRGQQDGGVICPINQRDGHPDLHARRENLDLICAIHNTAPALIVMAKRTDNLNRLCDEWRTEAGALILRADKAEAEASGLRAQIEAMTQINLALAQQFAAAVEERGRLRMGAEKAEAEATRYREMARRLAGALSEVMPGLYDRGIMLTDSKIAGDIAASLAESAS